MSTIRRTLLIVVLIALVLLALENLLTFRVMVELGVPRGMRVAAIEFAGLTFLAVLLIRRGRLRTLRGQSKPTSGDASG